MITKPIAISVRATPQERDAINYIAKQHGYPSTADYVRALIDADAGDELIELASFFANNVPKSRQKSIDTDRIGVAN